MKEKFYFDDIPKMFFQALQEKSEMSAKTQKEPHEPQIII